MRILLAYFSTGVLLSHRQARLALGFFNLRNQGLFPLDLLEYSLLLIGL